MDKAINKERYETDLARQCAVLGWCDRDSCAYDLNEPALNGYHYKEVDGGTLASHFFDGQFDSLVLIPGMYEGECDPGEVLDDAHGLLKTAHMMITLKMRHDSIRKHQCATVTLTEDDFLLITAAMLDSIAAGGLEAVEVKPLMDVLDKARASLTV